MYKAIINDKDFEILNILEFASLSILNIKFSYYISQIKRPIIKQINIINSCYKLFQQLYFYD
jgi:hypothetical protein